MNVLYKKFVCSKWPDIPTICVQLLHPIFGCMPNSIAFVTVVAFTISYIMLHNVLVD